MPNELASSAWNPARDYSVDHLPLLYLSAGAFSGSKVSACSTGHRHAPLLLENIFDQVARGLIIVAQPPDDLRVGFTAIRSATKSSRIISTSEPPTHIPMVYLIELPNYRLSLCCRPSAFRRAEQGNRELLFLDDEKVICVVSISPRL